MYFGTEYLSNIKDEALLKRLLPFTINEVYPNWATFLSLCFDLTDLSSDEVKAIVKKYSKRPPLRTIGYYCKKYGIERTDIIPYSIWVYFMLGYKKTTNYRVRQMASRLFALPFSIPIEHQQYSPYKNRYAMGMHKKIFSVQQVYYIDAFTESMFDPSKAIANSKVYVAKRYFNSYGRKKGWVLPKIFSKHKAKLDMPYDFNPLETK